MSDPITATLVMAAVGAVAKGVGAYASQKAENNQLAANASVMRQNAANMATNAALEKRRQERDLQESRRKFNLATGGVLAQSSALGIFGGSSLDLLNDIQDQSVFEQKAIVDERSSSRQSFYNQSAAYKSQSNMMLAGRKSAVLAGVLAFAGGGLSSMSSLMNLSPGTTSGGISEYNPGGSIADYPGFSGISYGKL